MSNTIALLTEAQFKTLVPVSKNLSISTPILQSVLEAQLQFIKPILCKDLWNTLMEDLENHKLDPNNYPISNEMQALIEEIRPALAWYTLYLLLPFNHTHIREIGTSNLTGDRAQVVDLNSLTYMRGVTLSSAETHAIQLKEFLEDNKEDYPDYQNCNCNIVITNQWFLNI